VLRFHVVDAERGVRDTILHKRLLERFGGGMAIRLEEQLDAVGGTGSH